MKTGNLKGTNFYNALSNKVNSKWKIRPPYIFWFDLMYFLLSISKYSDVKMVCKIFTLPHPTKKGEKRILHTQSQKRIFLLQT